MDPCPSNFSLLTPGHFLILAYPIPQPFSICRCHSSRRKMHKKHAPCRSTTATQGRPCGLFTMSAFDCLVIIGAKTGKREVSGCSLAVHAPGSLPSAILSLYAHAYCHSNSPKTFKGTHKSTRRSFRCCKNRLLPRDWYDNNTSSRWTWRNFGTWWQIFCGLSGSFSLIIGKIVARLTCERFNICGPNNWPLRNWRWTWSISKVLAKFPCTSMARVVVWMTPLLAVVAENAWCSASWKIFFFIFVLWQTRKRFYILLVVSVNWDILERARPSRRFQSNPIAITPWYPKYSAFDLSVQPVAISFNRTCRSFLIMLHYAFEFFFSSRQHMHRSLCDRVFPLLPFPWPLKQKKRKESDWFCHHREWDQEHTLYGLAGVNEMKSLAWNLSLLWSFSVFNWRRRPRFSPEKESSSF